MSFIDCTLIVFALVNTQTHNFNTRVRRACKTEGGDGVRGQRCGNSVIIANCLCTRCVPATDGEIGRRVSVVSNPCVQQTVRHGVIYVLYGF